MTRKITINDQKDIFEALKANHSALMSNALKTRSSLWKQLLDPRRNIDTDCGYVANPGIDDIEEMYDREGIARRVVHIEPQESWKSVPVVKEDVVKESADGPTDFDIAWNELNDQKHILSMLARADTLSGIGQFGIVLLGFNDGRPLSEAVDPAVDRQLLYVRVFDQTVVKIASTEKDPTNERFGLPTKYSVTFSDDSYGVASSNTVGVHWSRVIHIADNRRMSDVLGESRMKEVFNRLQDIRKVAGGSAEMYWQGAFPGIAFELDPRLLEQGDVAIDTDSLKEEMQNYINGLQRWLNTIGVSAKTLSPQVVDPTPQIELYLKLIAIAKGIPYRVFAGTEEGKLAGTSDATAWAERIMGRQERYLSPFVIRPMIQRLIDMGVLPRPVSFSIEWPSLLDMSEKERADVAETIADALKKYMDGGVDQIMSPRDFLVNIIGMGPEVVGEMQGTINEILDEEDADVAEDASDDIPGTVE